MQSLSGNEVAAVRCWASAVNRERPDSDLARRATAIASCLHTHWQLGLDFNQESGIRRQHQAFAWLYFEEFKWVFNACR